MELKEMTIEQLEQRRLELRDALENPDADLDKIESEINEIKNEMESRKAAEAKREELRGIVAKGEGEVIATAPKEERKVKTLEEIRSSKEYIDAFAEYIKTGDDRVCRTMTKTENASGYLPVPTVIEGRIRTAWEKSSIMQLVRKTYIRGNVRVGFELSADAAVVHTEGAAAPSDETLTFGVVSMVPQSIKKWIKITDEAMDMGGEEFLYYVYDELTYRIAKKAEDELLAKITALTASATTTAVSVGITAGTPSVGIVATAIGLLSDEAQAPVCVMNKGTWAKFKAAQYAGQFNVDPFEGLDVHFNNTLPVYATTGTTGSTWMIVGDFGQGAMANFPNGDDVQLKYDDLSLAEADLVKIVGREYVGLGIVADKAFVKITF